MYTKIISLQITRFLIYQIFNLDFFSINRKIECPGTFTFIYCLDIHTTIFEFREHFNTFFFSLLYSFSKHHIKNKLDFNKIKLKTTSNFVNERDHFVSYYKMHIKT